MARLESARGFVEREGRLLERRLLAGDRDGVVAAVAAYRNADGGFGHGLEPDKRAPGSQPLDVQVALEALAAVGHEPGALVDGACEFLAGVAEGGLVPILLPGVERHARADHWDADRYEPSLNPTAAIAAVLHRMGATHPWLDDATTACLDVLRRDGPPAEAHALRGVLDLLAETGDDGMADRALAALPTSSFYRSDPDDPAYGLPPTEFAREPSSPWVGRFPDLAAHLDRLEREQQPDGGWPVTWRAFSESSRLEWRGVLTVRAVGVLHAWGRL